MDVTAITRHAPFRHLCRNSFCDNIILTAHKSWEFRRISPGSSSNSKERGMFNMGTRELQLCMRLVEPFNS